MRIRVSPKRTARRGVGASSRRIKIYNGPIPSCASDIRWEVPRQGAEVAAYRATDLEAVRILQSLETLASVHHLRRAALTARARQGHQQHWPKPSQIFPTSSNGEEAADNAEQPAAASSKTRTTRSTKSLRKKRLLLLHLHPPSPNHRNPRSYHWVYDVIPSCVSSRSKAILWSGPIRILPWPPRGSTATRYKKILQPSHAMRPIH
jgi:hypothetical protein